MGPGDTGVPMDMNPEPRLAFLQCLSLPPFLLDRHTKPNLVAGKFRFISIRIFSGPTEIMILSPVLHLRESFVEHCQLQNQDINSHPDQLGLDQNTRLGSGASRSDSFQKMVGYDGGPGVF